MKTPIINQIDLFYDIIKQKSTYNALFGKSSPKDGRVLRWGMLISFFSLIPPFIILTKFQTDMLQFLFATLCLLAISIFIRYLFRNAVARANLINRKGYINFNERIKAEVLNTINENELDIHEVKELKETFYRLHVKHKTNYFSWELFMPVLTLIVSTCVAIWLKIENSEFMKISLFGFYILFAIWCVFRLSSSTILDRKSNLFFELYLIFSNIRGRDLNVQSH